jgi:SAM-dependent MidA family methyltransferase
MADELFEPITECRPLVEELRRRIDRDGPMTFRDFMDAALYHPRYGYYCTHATATSGGGDFVTSPELHPVFGALVARQLVEMWRALGCPARFDVVEPGAGRGTLARDVMAYVERHEPAFATALDYCIVEPRAALREEQVRMLAGTRVRWETELPREATGCVLSNELIDAFPVHRVRLDGGELREIYVGLDGGAFVDVPGPLSDEALALYFDELDILPGEGCMAEVNLEAPRWIAGVAAALGRGYVLTFDYGYEAADLYAPWRRDGTLVCAYRQSAGSDPYRRIGMQDMTASVDFTTLRRAGVDAGLRTLGFTDQASFLARLGIGEALGAGTATASFEEYFARRNVVLNLVDPAKLGRIRVLLQGKDVPDQALRGFRDG